MDYRTLLLAAIAGLLGGVLPPAVDPQRYRPDPFTGADARALEQHLEQEIERRLELLERELLLALPPDGTRNRILALEDAMRQALPGWRPPTSRFGTTSAALGGGGGE
jgi:hypothetical protein